MTESTTLDEVRRRQARREQRHQSRAGTTYRAFIRELCEKGAFDEAFAERAVVSVLCTLEQRLMSTEASDMEAQLPARLREMLRECRVTTGGKPRRFGRDEFLRIVARDLGLADEQDAESVSRVVFGLVRQHLSEGEASDVEGQLPADLRSLWRRVS